MNWNLFVTRIVVGALLAPAAAFGAAIEFTSAPVWHDAQLSLGFVFTTNQAIDVAALGYYDENEDGLLTNHEIGIFDPTGALVISTLLSAGSSSSLDGHYRYNTVGPITLPANSSFTIVATTFGLADGWAFGSSDSSISGFVVDPSISVASDASRFIYQNDNILRVPTEHFGGFTIYGGPNFLLGPANSGEVPEPTSVTLTLAGVAGLLFFSQRSKCTAHQSQKRVL